MMNRLTMGSWGAAAFALMTGGVHAACGLSDTNAVSVQDNSGQGNFSCSDLSSDGTVTNLVIDGIATVDPGTANKTARWFIPEGLLDTDNNGIQDTTYKIFVVSTVNGGGGTSCNYLYDGETLSGDNLGDPTGGQLKLNDTLVCGDPTPVAIAEKEPEPDIITTVGQNCSAKWEYNADNVPLLQDLSIGLTVDPNLAVQDTITVCANTGDGPTSIGQVQCAPPPYVLKNPTGDDCSDPDVDGSLPLSCAPVDITQAPSGLEYCWYYENRVCEADSEGQLVSGAPSYCADRTPGTFIAKTKKGSYDISIDVFDGSTCYTYFLYGRAYYHCF